MTKEQAIQIIKQALDQAVKGGIFTSLADTQIIITAYQKILQELQKEN